MKQLLVLLSLALLCLSCSSKEEKLLLGAWAIEEIIINDRDCKFELLANIMGFNKNGSCRVPSRDVDESNDGVWRLSNDKETIILNLEESFLNGEYKIHFEKDYNKKLLYLILRSKGKYIKAGKFMQNFNEIGKLPQ